MSLRVFVGTAVACLAAAWGASTEAAEARLATTFSAPFAPIQKTAAPVKRITRSADKLDVTLRRAADAVKAPQAGASVQAMTETLRRAAPGLRYRLSVPSKVPEVLTDIQVKGSVEAVKAGLTRLGARRISSFGTLISAWVPANRLDDAAAIGGIHKMRTPRARTHGGTFTSQGDFLQRSEFLRASTRLPNLDGTGIKVGVLSDSYGCTTAPTSADDDVASGDLPTDVQVLSELEGCDGATDEGRGMAQIVHDVAPGAKIAFYSAFNGEADFAAGIVALADAGATVIVDDIGYFDEPFFQDGIVAQAVDQVKARGVAYYSSAGNGARDSYEAPYADSGVTGPAGGMIDGEHLHNFDTSGATQSPILPITVPANSSTLVYLQWDDPYATNVTPGPGATSLLDLCLTGPADGGVGDDNLVYCTGPVAPGDDPFQIFGGVVDPDADFSGGLVVGLVDGTPPPGRLKIVYSGISVDQFGTASATVQGHPAARGASAVGAMYFRANPICLPAIYPEFTLEDYSSSGGTSQLFDTTGNRLPAPELRQKPEFVAPDGGATTFFSSPLGVRASTIPQCSNPANAYNFFGTSAAAPHAAGVSALLRQAQPKAKPDDLKKALQATALKNTSTIVSGSGSAGDPYVYANLPVPNFDVGYGLIQADAALGQVLPAITVAPTLAFGGQRINTTAMANLSLSDSGGFPLTISSVTATGPFTVQNGCPTPLAPAASCTLVVSFTPTQTGAATGTLTINSDAVQPDGSKVVTVALSGSGTQPLAALTPSTLDLGGALIGSVSQPATAYLNNVGSSALTISGISVSGNGFAQTNNCPATLPVNGGCAIFVTVSPTAPGAIAGLLTVTSDSQDGTVKTVSLTAKGLGPTDDNGGGGAFGFVVLLPGLLLVLGRRRRR